MNIFEKVEATSQKLANQALVNIRGEIENLHIIGLHLAEDADQELIDLLQKLHAKIEDRLTAIKAP